jgi:hypothetical protein
VEEEGEGSDERRDEKRRSQEAAAAGLQRSVAGVASGFAAACQSAVRPGQISASP